MESERLKKKIKEILSYNKGDLYKKIAIMGVVTKALEDLDVKPVIVGGQAVEFYTSGGYTTMDVDILCEANPTKIDSKLKTL